MDQLGTPPAGRFAPHKLFTGNKAVPWLSTAVIGATLVSARPAAEFRWLWVVYGVVAVCWACWLAFAERAPVTMRVVLILAASVLAVTSGVPSDASAVIVLCVIMGTYASLIETSALALVLVSMLVSGLIFGSGMWWEHSMHSSVSYFGAMVIATLAGLNRRQYIARLIQVELTHREQLNAAAAEERARIGREMHDVLAHSLGALRVQLEVAHALLTEHRQIDRAAEYLGNAQRLAEQGLSDARQAVAALRETVRSLPESLRQLAESFDRDHRTRVEFHQEGAYRELAPAESIALLRIAREALTNAGKHARGRPVCICLRYGDDDVSLTVRNQLDEAESGERAESRGYGLTGMRERIELVDGYLRTDVIRDEQGVPYWQVHAAIPDSAALNSEV
ncbi:MULTISPECIES: sensor histidine kinase [unclassified Nocardia]|uniref:sensor histidine kinase n=1 Tax=unclassified Nocardia TaxID=2637762 RepID=UPI001CE3B7EC|nr:MULTISPECIES: histidine kinase [unclassified Nocardia]